MPANHKKSKKEASHKNVVKRRASRIAKKENPALGSTLAFYLDDFNKTLFPLTTNKFLIENGEPEIQDYIKRCLDECDKSHSFTAQRRVYAAKPGRYLRRTVKLDPVAEYYIYDVVFRNRGLFRKPHEANRTHYGYRFENGRTIAPTAAYKAFKGALSDNGSKFKYSLGMDVASYFNCIYHHDIVSWFNDRGASTEDVEGVGQLLREINSGRSVDCLPQGIYPTKMIGNDFLRFVDNYHDLKSDQFIRFMDDIYLFSDDRKKLDNDFQTIQRLLGDKGLSINPRKTRVDDTQQVKIEREIDEVKSNLLKRRRLVIMSYDDDGEEIVKEKLMKFPLSADEISYINRLLDRPDIEEDDAELILTIMRGHAGRVEKRLPDIIHLYPHLAKNVHSFASGIADKEALASMIFDEVKAQEQLLEFQLFWFCAMLEDYFLDTTKASTLISELFNHRSATVITKARILEIPDTRFGLPELRNEFLGNGQSDWLAWSSAVGSRSLKPISRNYKLKYFGNSSQMNHLVASIISK